MVFLLILVYTHDRFSLGWGRYMDQALRREGTVPSSSEETQGGMEPAVVLENPEPQGPG